MSFGFAIGDFIAVGDLAHRLYKDVYKVSRAAPAEIRELTKEVSVLSSSIQLLVEEAERPDSVLVKAGQKRVDTVNEMMSSTKETLEKLDAYAKKHGLLSDRSDSRSALQRGFDKLKFAKDAGSINSLRAKLNYHCSVMNLLLTSIGNSSLERLENDNRMIARNVEQSLELIKGMIGDGQQNQGPVANQVPRPPVISATQVETLKDSLSLKFLEKAEETASWLEVGIDVWLQTGQNWLVAGKYGLAKIRTLNNRPRAGNDDLRVQIYIQTFIDLLKASWILVDVIAKHPQRPYITSGHRQAPITMLARDIAMELETLRGMEVRRPSASNIIDRADHTIFTSPLRLDPKRATLRGLRRLLREQEYWQPIQEPPASFMCFGNIEDPISEEKLECMVALTWVSDDQTFRLEMLDVDGYHMSLLLCRCSF